MRNGARVLVSAAVMLLAAAALGTGFGGGGGGPAVVKPVSEDFRKNYALNEAEILRWIEPPLPDSRRTAYFNMQPLAAFGASSGGGPRAPAGLIVEWRSDAEPTVKQTTGLGDQAFTVVRLLRGLFGPDFAQPKLDRRTLDTEIPGDFVLKAGAKPEELLPPLAKILSQALGRQVKVDIQSEKADVCVLSGQFTYTPLDDATWAQQFGNNPVRPRPVEQAVHLWIYAADLGPQQRLPPGAPRSWNRRLNTSSITPQTIADIVAERINAPFIIEAKNWPARFAYDDHGNIIDETPAGEAANTKSILDHLADQTGLTWKKEVRQIKRVVIENK